MQLTPTTSSKLLEKLREGSCQFAFKKKGGELRLAVGTLNLSLIPKESWPKGGPAKITTIPFWDFEKGGWRSLSKDTEIFM